MSYALNASGGWVELQYGKPIIVGDVATSYDSMLAWSAQYRTAQGIKSIEETEVPAGKVAVSSSIKDQGGKPVRVHVLADAPTPEPDPASFADLSDRQFFQALATAPYAIITQAEALDAVKTGEIPPVMQAVIDQLPEDQVFPTAMILSGATSFERSSPLVAIFGGSQGMDADAIDEFWRFAEAL